MAGWTICINCCTQHRNLLSHWLFSMTSGAAGCAPRIESAASQRESRACRIQEQSMSPSLMASSRFPAWVLGPHLFFSSPAVRSLRRDDPQRAWNFGFFTLLSIFRPSKKWLEFCLQKIGQKMQKSWIWGSPNPPKTDPKSFLNRGRQKVMIFHQNYWKF